MTDSELNIVYKPLIKFFENFMSGLYTFYKSTIQLYLLA